MEINERTDISDFSAKVEALRGAIGQIISGQREAVDMLLTCLVADGHLLIEGVPGVAKTLMVRLLAKLVDAKFSRIQFTPDLMPSDILGTSVFDAKDAEFRFRPGPVFADIVLADEINRAPAKTQAALFEAMEERQVTIDGATHSLGDVYTVVATQNPIEQEGTYRLPEAQLDRFMMKLTVGYPSADDELLILERHSAKPSFAKLDGVEPVITRSSLVALRSMVQHVVVDRSLMQYIVAVVRLTRDSRAVFMGASPRASVAMLQCSKAYALLQGRDFVTPDDIKRVAPYVLQHRIMLTAEAEMEGYTPLKVARRLIDKLEVPK